MWFKHEREALHQLLEEGARRLLGRRAIFGVLVVFSLLTFCIAVAQVVLPAVQSFVSWFEQIAEGRQEARREVLISVINDSFLQETVVSDSGFNIGVNEIRQYATFSGKCLLQINSVEHMAVRNPVEGTQNTVIRESYKTTYKFGSLLYAEISQKVRPRLQFYKGRHFQSSAGAAYFYLSADDEKAVRTQTVESSRNDKSDSLDWLASFHVQTVQRELKEIVEAWIYLERACGNSHAIEVRGVDIDRKHLKSRSPTAGG